MLTHRCRYCGCFICSLWSVTLSLRLCVSPMYCFPHLLHVIKLITSLVSQVILSLILKVIFALLSFISETLF